MLAQSGSGVIGMRRRRDFHQERFRLASISPKPDTACRPFRAVYISTWVKVESENDQVASRAFRIATG